MTGKNLSAICTSCGLCCNGTLYHVAPLSKAEHDNLIAVLDVSTDVQGNTVLRLPCTALNGTCCTMYETRPHICRSYRCGVLDSVADGSLEQEQAVQLVSQARSLTQTLATLLPAPDPESPKTLCQRLFAFYRGLQQLAPEHRQKTNPALLLAAGSLQIMLTNHFKVHELGVQLATFQPPDRDERTPQSS